MSCQFALFFCLFSWPLWFGARFNMFSFLVALYIKGKNFPTFFFTRVQLSTFFSCPLNCFIFCFEPKLVQYFNFIPTSNAAVNHESCQFYFCHQFSAAADFPHFRSSGCTRPIWLWNGRHGQGHGWHGRHGNGRIRAWIRLGTRLRRNERPGRHGSRFWNVGLKNADYFELLLLLLLLLFWLLINYFLPFFVNFVPICRHVWN